MQEKQLKRPCNSIDNHWNSRIFFDVFLLFYGNLTISIIFSEIPCCFQIYRLDKVLIKAVLLLYFGFI